MTIHATPPGPSGRAPASQRRRAIERQLARADRLLQAAYPRATSVASAETLVRACLSEDITAAQRLRALRLLARVGDRRNASADVVTWATSGIAQAEACGDRDALIALLILRGRHHARQLRLSLAVRDYERCLVLVRDRRTGVSDARSLATELHVLACLAKWRYLMGNLRETESLLDEARAVHACVPDSILDGAVIDDTTALLALWRGTPELAIKPACAAADAYTTARDWHSAARLYLTAATVCLDLADSFEEWADRGAFTDLAGHHQRRAAALAWRAHDDNALLLATLVDVRLKRTVGRAANWEPVLKVAVRQAEERHDTALLAQAFTALGDAYAAAGDEASAASAYTRVLETLDGSELIALGIAAHRALTRYDEQRRNDPADRDAPERTGDGADPSGA